MSTAGQRYGVGIGTGAAAGAATGSAILPGWGTAIGAAVGAIGGAVTAGMQGAKENDDQARLIQAEKRKKKAVMLNMMLENARASGVPTQGIEAEMAANGIDVENANEQRDFAIQHRIDPNSFAPMAASLGQAANSIYNKTQAKPLQLQPMMQQQPAADPNELLKSAPSWGSS